MGRWVAVAVLIAACGGSSGRATLPGDGEGTSVTFEQRVGWPFELRSVAVSVDGELAYLEREAHRRPPPGEVARVPLPSGEHTVSVQAVLAHPCAPLSEARQWITLRGAKTFRVGDDPGRVEVLVTAQGPDTGTLDDRVQLVFEARGVSFVGAQRSVPLPEAEQCEEMPPVHREACRVASVAAHARRVRDVPLLECAGDKLEQVERLRTVHGRLAPGDPMRGYLEERAHALDAEAVTCISGQPTAPEVTTSIVEGCGRYEEPPELEAWPVPDLSFIPPPA